MSDANAVPDEATLTREATRILRRLCEPGAVLAVSAQMDQAVVVRGDLSDDGLRTATVARTIAEVMALKSWISCDAPDRISRYRITPEGRSALGRMMADAESAATPWRKPDPAHAQRRPRRAPRAETPLMLLARRREKSGDPFLSPDLVHAGERFREDFELSQLGPRLTQDWDKTALGKIDTTSGSSAAPGDALRRFEAAKADLGDGLADVTVRCCCHLIGLETIEKEMGWSARSGKIVLRIALQRLLRHYQDTGRMDVLVG